MPGGRRRWYPTRGEALHAERQIWADRRVRERRTRQAERAARKREQQLWWQGLAPAQQRAYERIRRHLERAPGEFAWETIRRLFYGQNRRCFYCREPFPGGRKPSEALFEIEHKTPVVQGGTNDPGNLCLACRDCNREKSTCGFHDYIRSRRRRGLVAPDRGTQFPSLDLPERLAEEREARARRAGAMQAPTDAWHEPRRSVVRRRPVEGRGVRSEQPNWRPTPPSRKAKATGEASDPGPQ